MRVILRGAVMFGLFWGLVIFLNRWLDLSPDWPQWSVPLIGALGAELILWSYRYERQAVGEKRGRWLVALRISQLLLLCWILLEPVWSRYVDREIRREIVLLIDDSASMHLVDEGCLLYTSPSPRD